MFIKMRESKGFTLVELMIVVAIIGILAAVAVPYYQKYMGKARMTAKILPAVRVIQNGAASYWSLNSGQFTNFDYTAVKSDGNTDCIKSDTFDTTTGALSIAVDAKAKPNTCGGLLALDGLTMKWTPKTSGGVITGWAQSGTLATALGLQNEK